MSSLRVRVELNKGRRGIPLRKLSNITKETVKFLAMVCVDVGAEKSTDDWLALNFENNSVDFDCLIDSEIDERKATVGRQALRSIMGNQLPGSELGIRIRPATRLQYSHIASQMDPDELIRFGVYQNGEQKPTDWFTLDKSMAATIASEIATTATYFGEIQGIVHSFYKETDKPKFVIRELSTRLLIDCFFKPEMYRNAVEVLQEKDGVVFVEGMVTENVAEGFVESVEVTGFTSAPLFNEQETREFLGTHPDLTGNLTTEQYVERFRGHTDETQNLH